LQIIISTLSSEILAFSFHHRQNDGRNYPYVLKSRLAKSGADIFSKKYRYFFCLRYFFCPNPEQIAHIFQFFASTICFLKCNGKKSKIAVRTTEVHISKY
jgi:hypothetical protein